MQRTDLEEASKDSPGSNAQIGEGQQGENKNPFEECTTNAKVNSIDSAGKCLEGGGVHLIETASSQNSAGSQISPPSAEPCGRSNELGPADDGSKFHPQVSLSRNDNTGTSSCDSTASDETSSSQSFLSSSSSSSASFAAQGFDRQEERERPSSSERSSKRLRTMKWNRWLSLLDERPPISDEEASKKWLHDIIQCSAEYQKYASINHFETANE